MNGAILLLYLYALMVWTDKIFTSTFIHYLREI
jgi:hypothetical protein